MIDAKPDPAWQQRLAQNDRQYQVAFQAQLNRQQNQNAQHAQAYAQQNIDTIHRIGKASMDADRQKQAAIDHAA